MKLKGAGLLLALALAMGAGAAAAPLTRLDGLPEGTALAQQVSQHRRFGYRRFGCHWWRGCPYWYERTFWGAYHLHSPCSKSLTEHQY